MKRRYIFGACILLAFASCKKDHDPGQNCRLSAVTKYGRAVLITYNADGSVKSTTEDTGPLQFGQSKVTLTYFNNGTLVENISEGDSVRLDGTNRLLFLNLPFETKGRQERRYEYDGAGNVVRTHTNTGTGLDYLADLTWNNGDVVDFVYNIDGNPPNPDHFAYTFYDTLCPDRYTAMTYQGQTGYVFNRHLLKRSIYETDTTFYSYKLDDHGRIVEVYRDYDNSAWTWARAVDTTKYQYTCD